jgi:hypothetical protein
MAIQIKELIIKAICGDKKDMASGSTPAANSQEASTNNKLSFSQRKQLIEECTAEVMERLKRMNEF